METDQWWTVAPYERLIVLVSNEPSSFGEVAWSAGLWKTPARRKAAWEALSTLAANGLAERTPKGWVAAGPLADLKAAQTAAEGDYFNRLYDKAIAVGDIQEGDKNFCGDCCYQYDDVVPLDDVTIRQETLSTVPLSSAPTMSPDVNLTTSTARAALANVGILSVVGLVVLVLLPFIAIAVGIGWVFSGVGKLWTRARRRAD